MVRLELSGKQQLKRLPPVDFLRPGSDRAARVELPFRTLLYRYFFFGWLFRDASAGSFLERAAALQFNRERRIYLPTYLRRWLGLVVLSSTLGVVAEQSLTPGIAAAFCYGMTTVSIAIAMSIARSWLVLKFG
jgi:hypothetical protein